ncbi:MAG: hypothetical protein CMH57_01140 [Myxococcales bacterium]|nr:hypothetical protein [Myxococcales bacterium]
MIRSATLSALLLLTLALLPGCFFDVGEAPEAAAASSCERYVGPFDDPNALRMGAVFGLSGPSPELGVRSLNALTLATDQINAISGGVGGLQSARPLAFQVCDDQGNPDHAVLVANYLADTLGPAAIIGPAQSRSFLPVAEEVTIPRGIVGMSASATAVDISALDDNDLIWRTAPPDTNQPNALAYFAYWQLLRASALSGAPDVRVALINSDDAYGQGFADTFKTSLSALAGQNLNISFVPLAYSGDDTAAVTQAGQDAIAALPLDAALLVGAEETADVLAVLTTDEGAGLRDVPFFMPDGTRSSRLRTLFSSEDEKPRMLFGVNPAFRVGEVFDAFEAAYTETYNADPDTWTEHVYDAVYILAIAASGIDGEPTGAAVAEQLMRLNDTNDGRAVNLVPDDLVAAFNEMATPDGSLDVTGASGPLDFDNSVGEPVSAGILRWDVQPGTQRIRECGLASIYFSDNSIQHFWCNARCMPDQPDGCVPPNAP